MNRTVLLVEDDPAQVRFFRLVTEDLGIALLSCGLVTEAVQLLRANSVQLVVTDLMLPVASGSALLQQLRQDPALLGHAKVAVCSAGITADMAAELTRLGAWRLLHKPVSVQALRHCVMDGLGLARPGPEAPALPPVAPAAQATGSNEEAALARYFAGNLRLFTAFRESCLRQFPVDLATGDEALAQGDHAAMRRLAHSLKSVFMSLGQVDASAMAQRLELAAAGGDWAVVVNDWPALRARLASFDPA